MPGGVRRLLVFWVGESTTDDEWWFELLEVSAYALMCVVAYLVLVTGQRRALIYFWFAMFMLYSVIVRTRPLTGDMVGYASALAVWPPPLIQYTLREPVIWLGGALAYRLIGGPVLLFLAIDVLTGVLVMWSLSELDDECGQVSTLSPIIISSYVFLLGQQNAWRQHVAFAILLCAIALRVNGKKSAIIWFVVSVLTHNATAVLFGYWFDVGRRQKGRYGPLITAFGMVVLSIAWPLLGKSASDTGVDTRFIYVALTAVLILLLILSNIGRLPTRGVSALLNFVAFMPALAVLRSAQFERIAMMFLLLIVVELYVHHRSLRLRRDDVAQLAYAILVVPVFLFQSTLGVLFE